MDSQKTFSLSLVHFPVILIMSPKSRTGKRTLRAILPLVMLIVAALAGIIVWFVYVTTHPPARPYIVTPGSFQQLSERGLSATDETWKMNDGATARGWLLRGKQSAPAVIFLHPYGGNRSYFLNLGIKLSEATNFTVLWIDARGHGAENVTGASAFGTREAGDITAATNFLRALTTGNGEPLISGNVGIYGVEMGAYTALVAAADNPNVRALVLDSVVADPSQLLNTALAAHTGLTDPLSRLLAGVGGRLYFAGNFPGKHRVKPPPKSARSVCCCLRALTQALYKHLRGNLKAAFAHLTKLNRT